VYPNIRVSRTAAEVQKVPLVEAWKGVKGVSDVSRSPGTIVAVPEAAVISFTYVEG